MRILFVHESAGNFGGAEANVFATAIAARNRGHEIALAALRRTGKGEGDWEKLFGLFLYFPKTRDDWTKILEKFQPDVVYMHKWDDLDSLDHLLSTRLPLVRMVHDHDMYCLRTYKYDPFTRQICNRPAGGYCVFPCLAPIQRNRRGLFPIRWASLSRKLKEIGLNRKLDCLVVASEHMRQQLLINRFKPDLIRILPPIPPPSELLQSTFGPRNLLIFSGQLVRGKGVDVLLHALSIVKEPFECLIFGDGSHRRPCEDLCRKLRLEKKVRFFGFVSNSEIREQSREASVALVSSVWPEPFGLVGLEAMRCGLPVVAFDAGGIGDWLKDNETGFLVPWMDVPTYASRIDQLLRDKQLARKLGENGRKRVLQTYDFNRYMENLETLFMNVKQEPRRRWSHP